MSYSRIYRFISMLMVLALFGSMVPARTLSAAEPVHPPSFESFLQPNIAPAQGWMTAGTPQDPLLEFVLDGNAADWGLDPLGALLGGTADWSPLPAISTPQAAVPGSIQPGPAVQPPSESIPATRQQQLPPQATKGARPATSAAAVASPHPAIPLVSARNTTKQVRRIFLPLVGASVVGPVPTGTPRPKTPPQTSGDCTVLVPTLWQDGEGGAYVEAQVPDCDLESAHLMVQSSHGRLTTAAMSPLPGDEWAAAVDLSITGVHTYTVAVTSTAGLTGTWQLAQPALYSAAFGTRPSAEMRDPLHSGTGGSLYEATDASLLGRGDTALVVKRMFNGQDLTVGDFGAGWSSSLGMWVELVDNALFKGAVVHYGNGRTARFKLDNGTYVGQTPGIFDTFSATAQGYVITTRNGSSITFDSTGAWTGVADAHGNTVTATRNAGGQLVGVRNSSGRALTIERDPVTGFIAAITDGTGLRLEYRYAGDLLASATDSRGLVWQYTYDKGRLASVIQPSGVALFQFQYDAFDRVQAQTNSAGATRRFFYDDAARTTTIIEGTGRRTVHGYDEAYRLTKVVDSSGLVENYGYNQQGLRSLVRDKRGNTWTSDYDERGNLLKAQGPGKWSLGWEYNQDNKITRFRDARGKETTYEYDADGNLTLVRDSIGDTRSFEYDSYGQLTGLTDATGNTLNRSYDVQGNLSSTENQIGARVEYSYDAAGRPISTALRSSSTLRGAPASIYTYEYAGRSRQLTDIRGPLGYHQHYTYDALGNLSSITDPNGHTTYYNYDDSGKLSQVTDALGGTTKYTYGSSGEMLTVEDAEGRVTTYAYDSEFRVTSIAAPEGATTRFTYDEMGRVLTQTDPNGRVTAMTYDDQGRLITSTQNSVDSGPENADTNLRTTYVYDDGGNLISKTEPNGRVTTFAYDDKNRLTSQTFNARPDETVAADVNVLISYEYDANNNLIKQVDGRGFATSYAYDSAHRLESTTDALSNTTTYTYDEQNNPLTVTDPLGTITRYTYDALNRTASVTNNSKEGAASTADTNVTTSFEYDLVGNVTRVTDALGNSTSSTYDALNRVILVTDALSGETRFEYDRVNNLIATTDANNHRVTMSYDGLNRQTSIMDPLGYSTRYTYDLVGNLLTTTDALSHTTSYRYDALNRVVSVVDALGSESSTTYDLAGKALTLTDANQHTTTYAYDGLSRLKSVTDAEGNTTAYERDANGNLLVTIDANDHRTTQAYDALQRVERITNAEDQTTTYRYDAAGNLIDVTAADGVISRRAYDGLYRLESVTRNYREGAAADANVNVTFTYDYDANGNTTAITDPLGHRSTFEFDALNRMKKETNPIGSVWQYEYDPVGNRTKRIDANNHSTTYLYDANDQLTTIDYDDGTQVSYTYDPVGNPLTMVDGLGITNWSYDAVDRLTSAIDPFGRSLEYTYDKVGNQTSMTLPQGGVMRFTYLRNNWLNTVTDPAQHTTAYERDGIGQMTRTIHANDTTVEAAYDRADRLTSLVNKQHDGTVIASVQYTLNTVGLRTSADMTYGWRQPERVSEDYTYDDLRRLVGVTDTKGFESSFTFDAVGNRQKWVANDDQTTQRPDDGFEFSYRYDSADRLLSSTFRGSQPRTEQVTSYTYDANGNTTGKEWNGPQGPQRQGVTYTYDRENRLKVAQSYQANAKGHRVDRDVVRLFYDGGGRRLAKEYDPKTGNGGVKRTEYTFDGQDPVVEYSLWNHQRDEYYRGEGGQFLTRQTFPSGSDGQSRWYHYDGRGNVAGLTKDSGQAIHTYRYDSFGQLLPANGNFTDPNNHYGLNGKEWDENLGMYEFGERMYEPKAGRWLTADPFRGSIDDPGSLHRYGYVLNSPISYRDAYGNWGFSDLTDWASNTWDSASNTVSDAWDNTTEWASDTWDSVSETASNAWDATTEWASDSWDSVSNTAQEWYDSASESVNNFVDNTANAVAASWTAVTDAASTTWNTVSSTVSSAASSIGTWVSEHKDQLASMAVTLVVGTALTIGVAALCAATVGVGCVLAGGIIGGAAGGFFGTLAGNAVGGRPLGENLLANTLMGGLTGGITAGLLPSLSGLGGSLARSSGLGQFGQTAIRSAFTVMSEGLVGGATNTVSQIGSNMMSGRSWNENLGSSFAQGFVTGAATSSLSMGGQSAWKQLTKSKTPGSSYTLTDSVDVAPGKEFTAAQKQALIEENMARNGGVVRSDLSGEILVRPAKSQRGVTPSSSEWQIDHIIPRSKGGSNSYSNAQILSRAENRAKWDR